MSANRAYADVLIEAPSEQWARMIESHLQTSLADEGYAQLAAPGEPAPNSAPSVPRVFRCSVESSMLSEEALRDRVVAAIEDLDEAGVEKNSKSEAIEMIGIKPLEWLELESEEPLA
jgi:hypothetical protein